MSKHMMTWQAIQEDVLARIRNGEWRPGELIPTECELAAEFRCARATVNRALSSLAESGLLERRRKVGTRVARHLPNRAVLRSQSIRDEIETKGGVCTYNLISARRTVPSREIATQLMTRPGEEVFEVRADFAMDDAPYSAEIIWASLSVMAEIENAPLAQMPAIEWIFANVAVNHGTLSIGADSARDSHLSSALQVDGGSPVLVVERTNWADAVVTSFSRQFYPSKHKITSTY